jgi:hypothetical protein
VCETPAAPGEVSCAQCGGELLLHGRYLLERLLGSGGQSRVYAARDQRDGGVVAVKVMALGRAREWKAVELFRRAGAVLAGLSHPGIPRVVESFEESRPGGVLFCLVHEFIEGETLAQSLKGGARYDERRAQAVAREALGILRYLHSLSPPVIHRDVKPSNLMRTSGPDGRLVLIDFDLVRDVLRPDGGSTVSSGTPGYAPLEQFMGEPVPATDLYALGVTLAVLLARKEPEELRPSGGARLSVRAHVNVSEGFLRILERLVEPEVGRRYQSAPEVLADLDRLDRGALPSAAAGSVRPEEMSLLTQLAVQYEHLLRLAVPGVIVCVLLGLAALGAVVAFKPELLAPLGYRPKVPPAQRHQAHLLEGPWVGRVGRERIQMTFTRRGRGLACEVRYTMFGRLVRTEQAEASVDADGNVKVRGTSVTSPDGSSDFALDVLEGQIAPIDPRSIRGRNLAPRNGDGEWSVYRGASPASNDPPFDVGGGHRALLDRPWAGTVEGRPARLVVEGDYDALRGRLTVGAVTEEVTVELDATGAIIMQGSPRETAEGVRTEVYAGHFADAVMEQVGGRREQRVTQGDAVRTTTERWTLRPVPH